jgi:hypothetical protein
MEGLGFIYFSFNGVDFRRKMVKGWVYEAGKGVEQQKEFPDVIINSYIPKAISNL